MKQILCRVLLLLAVIAAILGLSSCNIFFEQEDDIYKFDSSRFDREVAFGEELDLGSLVIEVFKPDGTRRESLVVTKSMVVSGDTNSIGDHELVVEYGGERWTVMYTVFYEIKFTVPDDPIQSTTQLVSSADEIIMPEDPVMSGSTFLGWSKKIPSELTGNMELFAIFADRITIPKFEATYGDKLSSLELPEIPDAKWEWVDDPETTYVGNATEGKTPNSFQILYVPDNDDLDPIEFTTTVNVKKKALTFTAPTSVEYDPNAQKYNFLGMYTLTGFIEGEEDYKPRVLLLGDNNVSEIGKYSYTLGIADTNYRGDYVGYFEITPIHITVDVTWKSGKATETIIYGGQLPEYEYTVKDKNGNVYTEFISSDLKISIQTPTLEVGTYYLGAVLYDEVEDGTDYTQYYNVTVNDAELIVESKVMNPGDPALAEEYVIYYGDTLGEFKFAYHPNGTWKWVDDPSTPVGNVGSNKFKAQFTPFSDNYDAPEPVWVTLEVLPKELTFKITSPTRVTYDGKPHSLTYEIIDPETGEKFDKELAVSGNYAYTNASKTPYSIVLVFDDTNYEAKNNTFNLTIDKATPTPDFSAINDTWKFGMTVSEIDLSGVVDNQFAGKFSWDNGGQTVNKPGTYEFEATFNPSDSDNYNTVKGKITVVLDKDTPEFKSDISEYTDWVYDNNDFILANKIDAKTNSNGKVKFLLQNGTETKEITSLRDAGTYTVIIVVEASDDGCYKETTKSVTVTIGKVDPVIYLSINGWTYDHTANQPVASCDPIGSYNIDIAGYEYRLEGTNEWIDFTDTSYPVKAGKYEVRAYVDEGENHNASVSDPVAFVIGKQEVSVPSIDSMTYNKEVQYPDISNTALYTVATQGTDGNMGGEDVGDYYVTLTLVDSDNYKWPGTDSASYKASYSITKATVNVIKDFDGGEWTYSGIAQVNHSTTADFGEVEFTYYIVVSETNRILIDDRDDIIDAGTYVVVASVEGNSNYVSATPVEKTFVINKAVVNKPYLNSTSFEYNGQTIVPTVIDNNANNAALYVTSQNNGNKNIGTGYTVVLAIEVSKFANYRWEGQEDNERYLTLTYDITRAEVDIKSVTQPDWTYAGSVILPTVEINKGFSVNYKYEYRLVGTDEWSETVPTNVGDYEVRVTVIDDTSAYGNYIGGENKSKVDTFKITPKAQNLNVTLIGGVYNGTDLTSGLSGVSGIYTVTDSGDAATSETTGTAAGTYVVTFTLVPTDEGVYNYVWGELPEGAVKSEDGKSVTISYTIEKKSVSKPTFISDSFTYALENGTAKNYVVTASQLNNFNADYMSISCDPQNQAGAGYTATVTLDSNHKWDDGDTSDSTTVSWSIDKGQAEISVDTTTIEKIYGQSITLPTATTNFGTVECDKVASDLVNYGTYTVTYRVEGTDNYNGDEESITVVINKAKVSVSGISITGWTYHQYNANLHKPTFTSATTETGIDVSAYVTFEYSANGIDGWSADIPENAGTYYLRAKISASVDGNWDETYVKAASTFEIAKQDVPVPDIVSPVYSGETLYPTISNTELYTVAEKGTDGNKGGIDIGTYYVTLTLTDSAFVNHNWSGSDKQSIEVPYTIVKVTPDINPGFTSNNASKEYDGISLNLIPSATAGITSIDRSYITIKYYQYIKNETTGDYYYDEIEPPKNVGTYYVKVFVTAEASSNWSALETDDYIKYEINPRKIDPAVFTGDSIYYYENTLKTPSVSTSGDYTSKWYTVVNGELGVDITNTINANSVNVGKYIIVVSLNNSNYVWRDTETADAKTFEYEIKQSSVTVTDITFKNGETTLDNTWVFGTTVTVDQTTDKTFTGITFTYKYEYKLTIEGNDKWTVGTPANVGEYHVRVTVNRDEDENYVGISHTEVVTITTANETPSVTLPDATKPGNPVYTETVNEDGSVDKKLTLDYIPDNTYDIQEYLTVTLATIGVKESDREIEKIIITRVDNASAFTLRAANVEGTLSDAGKYAVTYYFESDSNYEDASVTVYVTITQKSIADVTVGETVTPVVNVNFGYNNTVFNNGFQPQSIVVTLDNTTLVEGTAYTWIIKDEDGNTVSASGIKDAGTYTVTITGQGNYTGEVVRTFTVEKQGVDINTSIDNDNPVEYKENTKYSLATLIDPRVEGLTGANFLYYVDGSVIALEYLEKAGTFSVKVVLVHDNYKAEKTVSVTVNKNTSDTGTPSNKTATYGDTLFSVVGALPDHTEYGTWSWENANEDTTVGAAGENTFWAVFTSNNNNYDDRRVPVTITVSKSGDVTITTDVNNSKEYNGTIGHEIKDLINPSVDGIENETFNYYLVESKDGVNVETPVTKLIDAKTYRIKVVLDHANFKAETYVDVTINPNTTATGTVNVKNTATYLDKLSSLGDLPTSIYGTWSWADADKNPIADPTLVTVGNATVADEHNIFYAIFTPYSQYEGNYAKREVKIEVYVDRYEITKPDDITENYTGDDVISSHFTSHKHSDLFDVTYQDKNNVKINVGEYTATLTLKDDAFKNYKWKNTDDQSVTVNYKISESAIQWTITGLDGWTFGDSVDVFTVSAKYGETSFGYTVEYKLSSDDKYNQWTESSYPDKAETYTIRFTALADDIESYENVSVTKEITVSPRSVFGATVTLNKDSEIYTGSNFVDLISVNSVKLTVNGEEKTLVKDTDYTVTIPESIIDVDSYTITVTGTGNYSGTATATFIVGVREITPSVTGGYSFVFNTKAQHPTVESSDYYITKWYKIVGGNYEEITSDLENSSIGVGSYVAVVTLNYTHNATHTNIKWADGATTSFSYSITPKDISDIVDGENSTPVVNVVFGNSLTYNGGKQSQTVTVTWQRGENDTVTLNENNVTDYTWTIKDPNGNIVAANEIAIAGTYTVVITGEGNYTGSVTRTFEVAEKSISGATVSLEIGDLTNGKYVVTYSNTNFYNEILESVTGVKIGTLTATYGNVIIATDIAGTNTVTEVKNAGIYYVIVTGTGNFEGTAYATFEVKVREITAPTFSGGNSFTYNGLAQAPTVTHTTTDGNNNYYTTKWYKVENVDGVEEETEVSKEDIIKVGNYKVVIALDTATHGNNIKWADGATTSFSYSITPKDISDIVDGENSTPVVNVVFDNSLTYNGGNQSQTVTVTWQRGEDDIVTLNANNVTDYTWTINGVNAAEAVINSAGTYTVVITGTGNYTGSVEREFVVAKASASITGTPGNISNVAYDPAKTYLENLFVDNTDNVNPKYNVDVKYTSGSKDGQTTGLTPTVTVVYAPFVGETTTTTVEKDDTYEIKNAGTYTITYSFSNVNFNEVADVVVTVEIGQATETLDSWLEDTDTSKTYGDKLSTLPESDNGTWTWKDATAGETLVGDVTTSDAYRTFYAEFTPKEGYENNYATLTGDNAVAINIKVSKATPKVYVNVFGKTYDSTAVSASAIVSLTNNEGMTIPKDYTAVYYYVKNAEGKYVLYGTDGKTEPTDVGDYAIRVVVGQSTNWNRRELTGDEYDATFSITAKEVTVDLGANVTNGILNLTYNDGKSFDLTTELGATFVDVNGNAIKDGIKYYMTVDDVLTEVTKDYITNHGEYTVIIKLDNANYTVTNSSELTITVKVAKKGIDLPEYVKNLDYIGKDQTPTITHNPTVVGNIAYKDLYEVTYENNGANQNVGTYGIYFKLTDEAFKNYKWNDYGEDVQSVDSLTYNITPVDLDVSVEITDASATNNSKTYDTTAMGITTTVKYVNKSVEGGYATVTNGITVYYYVKSGENYVLHGTDAPTDVGEYAIRVVVTGGEGYNWNAYDNVDESGNVTKYDATFSITKKSISGATVSLGIGDLTNGKYVVTYSNTNFHDEILESVTDVKTGTLTATYGNVIIATDIAGTNTVTDVKNAGTYYVVVEGTGNFEGTAYATFEVKVREITAPEITGGNEFEYTSVKRGPTVNTASDNSSDYYEVKWYKIVGGSYKEITTTLDTDSVEVGDYVIVVSLKSEHAGNIKWLDAEEGKERTDIEHPYSIIQSNLITDEYLTGTATYEDLLTSIELPEHDKGTWSWKTTVDENGNALTVGNATAEGEYNTFTAVFTPYDTTNYATQEIDFHVTVNKKSISIKLDENKLVYTGSEIKLVDALIDSDKMTFEGVVTQTTVDIKNTAYPTLNSDNYVWAYDVPRDAGGNVVIKWTISRKSISDATVNLSSTSSDYTGDDLTPTVNGVTLEGYNNVTLTLDGTKIKVSITDLDDNPAEIKNVGKYKITVEGTGNFTGTASARFEVTPADTEFVGSNHEFDYDPDKTYDPLDYVKLCFKETTKSAATLTSANYTVKYVPNVGDSIDNYTGNIQAAGTYMITYSFTDTEGNLNAPEPKEIVIMIKKVDANLSIGAISGGTYSGTAVDLPSVTVNGVTITPTDDAYESYVTITKDGKSATEIKNAGKYTIALTYNSDNNYNLTTETKTVEIIPIEATISGMAQSGLVYTGSTIPTNGTAITGISATAGETVVITPTNFTYTYKHSYESFDKATALTEPNATEIKNAGYYEVTISFVSTDGNYAGSETIDVYVRQKTAADVLTDILSGIENGDSNYYHQYRIEDLVLNSGMFKNDVISVSTSTTDGSTTIVNGGLCYEKVVMTFSNVYLNSNYKENGVNVFDGYNYNLSSSGSASTAELKLYIVAIYDDGVDLKYYRTIEEALNQAVSGDTVWVMPMTAVSARDPITILRDCEIRAGATLVLPYGLFTGNDNDDVRNQSAEAKRTDTTCGALSRMTLVRIADGVTLTVSGTLEIAGQLSGGMGGNDYAGHTAGKYAELQLGNGATVKIENASGVIKAYGFITEESQNNGSQVILKDGALYQPFVLRDFNGGSYMATFASKENIQNSWPAQQAASMFVRDLMKKYYISPFNEFQFINVQAELNIGYNAEMLAWANMYSGDQQNCAEINIIGNTTNHLFQLTDPSSYFKLKYDKTTGVMDIDIYGGANLNSIELSLYMNVSIIGEFTLALNTNNAFFPISWAYDISLNPTDAQREAGTIAQYNFNTKVQFMPGSKFEIADGAKLTSAHAIYIHKDMSNISVGPANTIVYGDETDNRMIDAYTPVLSGIYKFNEETRKWYFDLSSRHCAAEFVVNGALEVHTLAGEIKSNNTGATVKITNSGRYALHKVIYHSNADKDSKVNSDPTVVFAMVVNADGSMALASTGANAMMTYNNGKWISNQLAFTTVTDGGTYDGTVYNVTLAQGSTKYTLPLDYLNGLSPVKSYYNFVKWYVLDENGNKVYIETLEGVEIPIDDFTVYVYAEWDPKTYGVEYENKSDVSGTELPSGLPTASGLLTEFTVETNKTIPNPANGNGWYFLGWYLDAEFTKKVVNYSEVTKTDGETTTLYARWTNEETYVITVIDPYGKITSVNVTKTEYDNGIITSLLDAASAYLNNPGEQYYVMGWLNSNNDPIKSWSDVAIENNATGTITVVWGQKYYVDFSGSNGLAGTNTITFDGKTDGYYTSDEIKRFMIDNLSTANDLDDTTSVSMYFKGWTFNDRVYYADEIAIDAIDFSSIDVNSTLSVKAAFAQKHTITISYGNLKGAGGTPLTDDVIYVANGHTFDFATYNAAVDKAKGGDDDISVEYYYAGYWTSNNSNYAVSNNTKITITADTVQSVTVTAGSIRKHEIKFVIDASGTQVSAFTATIKVTPTGSTTTTATRNMDDMSSVFAKPSDTVTLSLTAKTGFKNGYCYISGGYSSTIKVTANWFGQTTYLNNQSINTSGESTTLLFTE